MKKAELFLSTLSLRRATERWRLLAILIPISIHALLAESDGVHYDNYNLHCVISIHALLAESDARRASRQQPAGISIHALLAESDSQSSAKSTPEEAFLSTLSLRRATMDSSRAANCQQHFYPRSPCGERRVLSQPSKPRRLFLSTLSLRRATPAPPEKTLHAAYFYPRSPCGERPMISETV